MSALLRVDRLSKQFGGLKAVNDISFHAEEGEIVGIVGPNGAGKTTVINLVSGVYKPDKGTVTFRGQVVTGMPPHSLVRRGLVRTFQAAVVYRESSVRENALRGAFAKLYPGFWNTLLNTKKARAMRADAEQAADELLEWLGMTAVANVKAGSLPYGYQKTLGMIVALLASPKLIMLDEPAAGLSPEEADHVRDVIRRVNHSGVTVVVVDHNMRFMSGLCHRLVAMHHGAELAEGTPEAVLKDPRVIEAYLGRGFEGVETL